MTRRTHIPVRLTCINETPRERALINTAYKYMGECESFRTGSRYRFIEPDGAIIEITKLFNSFQCTIYEPEAEEEDEIPAPVQGLCISYQPSQPLPDQFEYLLYDPYDKQKFITVEVKIPQTDCKVPGIICPELIFRPFAQPCTPNVSWIVDASTDLAHTQAKEFPQLDYHLSFNTNTVVQEEPWCSEVYSWDLTLESILNTDVVNKYAYYLSDHNPSVADDMYLGEYRLFPSDGIGANNPMVWMPPFAYKVEEAVAADIPIDVFTITSDQSIWIDNLEANFYLYKTTVKPGYFTKPDTDNFELVAQTQIPGKVNNTNDFKYELQNKFLGFAKSNGTAGYLIGQFAEVVPSSDPRDTTYTSTYVYEFKILTDESDPDNIVYTLDINGPLLEYITENYGLTREDVITPIGGNIYTKSRSVEWVSERNGGYNSWIGSGKQVYTKCDDEEFSKTFSDGNIWCDLHQPDNYGFACGNPRVTGVRTSNGTLVDSEESEASRSASIPNHIMNVVVIPNNTREPISILLSINGNATFDSKRNGSSSHEAMYSYSRGGNTFNRSCDPNICGVEGDLNPTGFREFTEPYYCRGTGKSTTNTTGSANYTVTYTIGDSVVTSSIAVDEKEKNSGRGEDNCSNMYTPYILTPYDSQAPASWIYEHQTETYYRTNADNDLNSNVEWEGCKILYVDLKNDLILLETTKFISGCTLKEHFSEDWIETSPGTSPTWDKTTNYNYIVTYTNSISLKLEIIYKGERSTIREYNFNNSYSENGITEFDDRIHTNLCGEGVGLGEIYKNINYLLPFGVIPPVGISSEGVISSSWGSISAPQTTVVQESYICPDVEPTLYREHVVIITYEPDEKPDPPYTDNIYVGPHWWANIYRFLQRMRKGSSGIDFRIENNLLFTWGKTFTPERFMEQGSIFANRIEISALNGDHIILLKTHSIDNTLGSDTIPSEEIVIFNGKEVSTSGDATLGIPPLWNIKSTFVT